jgi:hypothetical protein
MHILTHSFDHNELRVDQLLSQHPRDVAMAAELGFTAPKFTGGADSSNHPPFWQTLASVSKPTAKG